MFAVPFALFLFASCERDQVGKSDRVSELEQANRDLLDRESELERKIEGREIEAQRELLESERSEIDAARSALENERGEAALQAEKAVEARERAIEKREADLAKAQARVDETNQREIRLSESDRQRAGREALEFSGRRQSIPVGDYGTFYDSLSPHGAWFETADYGYVWQPTSVRERDWRPYSRGRWACSDRGWTWISDEPYGWATYHYGRWALLKNLGWIWVPGGEWAPSWVSWRESDNHIGWAPLPPETLGYRGRKLDTTIDIEFSIGALSFNFVESKHFAEPVREKFVPVASNVTIFQNTTNITNITYQNEQVISGGPRYQKVVERAGKAVPFYRIEIDRQELVASGRGAMSARVDGQVLKVAAPNLDAKWNGSLKPQKAGKLERIEVERGGNLKPEIVANYTRSRRSAEQEAQKFVTEAGGASAFESKRKERLKENRRTVAAQPKEPIKPIPSSPKNDQVKPQPKGSNEANKNFRKPSAGSDGAETERGLPVMPAPKEDQILEKTKPLESAASLGPTPSEPVPAKDKRIDEAIPPVESKSSSENAIPQNEEPADEKLEPSKNDQGLTKKERRKLQRLKKLKQMEESEEQSKQDDLMDTTKEEVETEALGEEGQIEKPQTENLPPPAEIE